MWGYEIIIFSPRFLREGLLKLKHYWVNNCNEGLKKKKYTERRGWIKLKPAMENLLI